MVTGPLLNITKDFIKPKLFKRWMALFNGQMTIQWITQLVFIILIHWIAIYPVDSAIQLLNNRGQEYIRLRLIDEKFVENRMDTNAVSFWDPVLSLKVKTF